MVCSHWRTPTLRQLRKLQWLSIRQHWDHTCGSHHRPSTPVQKTRDHLPRDPSCNRPPQYLSRRLLVWIRHKNSVHIQHSTSRHLIPEIAHSFFSFLTSLLFRKWGFIIPYRIVRECKRSRRNTRILNVRVILRSFLACSSFVHISLEHNYYTILRQ